MMSNLFESGDSVRIVHAATHWNGRNGIVVGKLRYGTDYVVRVSGDLLYLPESQISLA